MTIELETAPSGSYVANQRDTQTFKGHRVDTIYGSRDPREIQGMVIFTTEAARIVSSAMASIEDDLAKARKAEATLPALAARKPPRVMPAAARQRHLSGPRWSVVLVGGYLAAGYVLLRTLPVEWSRAIQSFFGILFQ